MDPETVRRVFEPFFTTKDPDRGTGLGLAMVYGIIRAHAGQITCYSEPGAGTTFKIYLPALEPDAASAVKQAEDEPPPTGTERVLLVDDEPQVRDVGEQLLRAHGYEVATASTGEAALERVEQPGQAVDLVILDFIMPGMGGRRCLEKLRELRPDLPIIISSGYAAEATSDELLRQGANAFVSKPYQAKTLLRLVRRVLDREQTESDEERQRVLH
jgi:CheY-like chemotaxis protein